MSGTDERIIGLIGAYRCDAEGFNKRDQLSLDGLGRHVILHHTLKLKEFTDAFHVIDTQRTVFQCGRALCVRIR